MRSDRRPQPGQAACRAVLRASTRKAMSVVSTDSTSTFSSEENSNSSSCGRTSFTAQHCRPRRPPAGRFPGYLRHPHDEIGSDATYATTRSGPEPENGQQMFTISGGSTAHRGFERCVRCGPGGGRRGLTGRAAAGRRPTPVRAGARCRRRGGAPVPRRTRNTMARPPPSCDDAVFQAEGICSSSCVRGAAPS